MPDTELDRMLNTCYSKRGFDSEDEALAAPRRKGSGPIRAYQCAFCEQWHRTRSSRPPKWAQEKRPPRLSPEVRKERNPISPIELLGSVEEET